MDKYIIREQKPYKGSHENMIHILQTLPAPFNSKVPNELKPQRGMIANQVQGYHRMMESEYTNTAAYPKELDHMGAYHNSMLMQTNMAEYPEQYRMPLHDMGGYENMAPSANAYGEGQSTMAYYEKKYIAPGSTSQGIMMLDRPEYNDRQHSYHDHYRPNMPIRTPDYIYEPQTVRNAPPRPSATVTNQQASWIQPISPNLVSEPPMVSGRKPTLIESQKSFMDIQKETNVSSAADVSMSKSIPSSEAGCSKAKDLSAGAIQEFANGKNKTEIDVGLRVFTGNVEKVLKWNKVLKDLDVSCLFEVIGKCVIVSTSKQLQKHFLLRDQTGPVLQVVFHEIDFLMQKQANGSMIRFLFELPQKTLKGLYFILLQRSPQNLKQIGGEAFSEVQLIIGAKDRVVGRMASGNRLQAFCVRAARGPEVEALPRLAALSHHHVAKLNTAGNTTANNQN